MAIESVPGLAAVILGIISFYGMTYVVIALNVGWRFGYWVSSATFGALMVLLSIFWVVNPVGPRGPDASWVPLAAARETVSGVSFKDESLSTPSSYPGSPWTQDEGRQDAFGSSVSNCLSTEPESLPELIREPCADAHALLPPDSEIPVLEGSPIAVTPEVENVRFATENGALLGEATIVPTTHDPRVAKDPIKGEEVGDPFRLLAVYDKGSVRLPPFVSLLIFLIYFGIHLAGLNRAEKRKLSPILA